MSDLKHEYYFDEVAANRVRTFFKSFLRHSVGQYAGKPFDMLDWQWEDIVKPLFGWKRKSDGTRRYRECYVEVPKKQGKSTLCAGLALYLLLADGENSPEVYGAAADVDQARIVFNEALRMVNASPLLKSRLWPVPSKKVIECPRNHGIYRALSSESHTKEGLNIHALIFDELHAQPSPDLYNTLKYGGIARRQPMFIYITTAGFDRESICWEKHQRAMEVLDDPAADEQFFAYVRGIKEDEDWQDPKVWARINPSMGVTMQEQDFAHDAGEAKKTPSEENEFRRYRLNEWTQQEIRWLSTEHWDACRLVGPEEDLVGQECYGGLDLAATRDINAFVLWFPKPRTFRSWFWIPHSALAERVRIKRTPLDRWAHVYIKVTEGRASDYDVIESDIIELSNKYRINRIGIDSWNTTTIAQHLADRGLQINRVGQGYASLNNPMKFLERCLVQRDIHHDGSPVMRWMFGNIAVKQDPAANIKPDRSCTKDKIDGISALLDALSVWIADEEGTPYYQEHRYGVAK